MASPASHRFGPRGALVLCLLAVLLLAAGSERLRGLFAHTALLACGAIGLSTAIGVVLGAVIAKIDVPGRRALVWLMAGLLFVPLYVQAAAWYTVLGPGGWVAQWSGQPYARPWLEGWRGAIWIHAMAAVPLVALLTAASLAAVERRLEEESLLDASPLRVLTRVSLRRGLGGVLAAAVWTAVVCATEITVTDLFQIRTFAEEVYTEASLGPLLSGPSSFFTSDLAVGVAALALVAAAAILLIVRWLPTAGAIAADSGWRWHPVRARWAVAGAAWILVAAVVVAPLAGLAWRTGIQVERTDGEYHRSWSAAKAAEMVANSPWGHRRELGWSLAIGGLAATTATAAGLVLAWAARESQVGSALLGAAMALCLAVPGPLWGVWAIWLLNQPADSPLGALTVLYDRTVLAPVLVQLARSLPLATLWLWTQMASIPHDVLDAARSEGAGPLAQLLRVAWPLRRMGVLVAGLAALAISVGELPATLLVVPPGVTTLSVRIFQLLHYGVDDRVAAISLAVFGIVAAIILVAAVVERRQSSRRRRVPQPPGG